MFLAAAASFLLLRFVRVPEVVTVVLSLVSLPGMATEMFLRLTLGATGISTVLPYGVVDALVFGAPACLQGLTYAAPLHVLRRLRSTSLAHPATSPEHTPAG
ncbi:hypothetical protein EDD33_1739 [Nocardioides aurantiacus]|uniref:Uncharacterized protein n=1 Tax=Nocardioides aurantiacus TaxID=86796 RepID=A0A3N2CTM4_9ACTN|nr:hypothetical protein EDD33_1739 [Nocardioides aurantiacus]